MSRWKVHTGLFVLFLSGMIVGGCLTMFATKKIVLGMTSNGPASVRSNFVRGLSWHLGLNEQQRKKAAFLFAGIQDTILEFRVKNQEEIKNKIDAAEKALLPDLNPTQQEKLTRLRDRSIENIGRWPEWKKETDEFLEANKSEASK